MSKPSRWVLVLAAVTAWLAGCAGGPASPTRTADALPLTLTAYVAGIRAARTATAQARPTATPTPAPTATATATPTPSPQPTMTPSPAALLAEVRGNLFCRQGPAPYYRAVAVLRPGQQVPVVAYNPVYYAYVVLQMPNGAQCWAWTRWLRLPSGEEALRALSVATPPPPPAAAFAYPRQNPVMLPFCPTLGSPALQVQITNRGWKPLASLEAEITVLETGARYRTVFPNGVPTCTQVLDHIQPGGTVAVALRTRENLLEKRVRLFVKMCTRPGFQGECAAYAVYWTIPKPRPIFPFPGP